MNALVELDDYYGIGFDSLRAPMTDDEPWKPLEPIDTSWLARGLVAFWAVLAALVFTLTLRRLLR